jgi:hypothetical protein
MFLENENVETSNEWKEYCANIERLAFRLQHEDERNTLLQFSRKLSLGQALTEKQKKYFEILLARAQRGYAFLKVDDDIKNFIFSLEKKIKHGISSYYWNARPGTYSRSCKIIERFRSHKEISGDDFEFLRSVFKSWTLAWDSSKELDGCLFYIQNEPALVLGNRSSNQLGTIVVDVLCGGAKKTVNISSLKKRFKK